MARRRRKGRGHKQKAFPLLAAVPIIPPLYTMWNNRASGPAQVLRIGVQEISGIDITGQLAWNQAKAVKTLGLVIVGMVGHKVANKVGVNKYVRKLSLGYLTL